MENFKRLFSIFLIISFISSIFYFSGEFEKNRSVVYGASDVDLKKSIEEKNEELQKVNSQIKETQQELNKTQQEGQTLKRDLNRTDSQLKQINLGIRSSEITIDKLGLEIKEAQEEIEMIENNVENGKAAIADILRELQKKDKESPLLIILKNGSLSDAIFEIQNLNNLNDNLAKEISSLKILKDDLSNALGRKSDKKNQTEVENFNLKNKKTIAEDEKKSKEVLLTQTKNQESVYQKQLNELKKIQEQIGQEIEIFERELRLKIDPSLLPIARPGVLQVPVNGPLTQGYGKTSYSHNYSSSWHNGIDFGAPVGTPVVSAEKGKVVFSADQDKYCRRGAYGKVIAIKHENNLTTMYSHFSLIAVKEGQEVERGQVVGYVGKTGWATGPHLHFTVFASNTFIVKESSLCGPMPFGGDLNPLKYMLVN